MCPGQGCSSKPLVIFGDHTCIVKLIETPFAQGADGIKILETIDAVDPRYLYHILRVRPIEAVGYQRHFSRLKEYEIPLPQLEVQQEIVMEIDGYQRVIDGARAVIDNYKPTISIDPKWPIVRLGDACEVIMDGSHYSPQTSESGPRLYLTSKNVRENYLDLSDVRFISEGDHKSIYNRCPVKKGDVLYIKDGANTGLSAINNLSDEFSLLSSVAVLRGKEGCLDNHYLSFYLNTISGRDNLLSMMSGVAIRRLTLIKIHNASIPLPPLDDQKKIVAQIKTEQNLVASNQTLIGLMEDKVKATVSNLFGYM